MKKKVGYLTFAVYPFSEMVGKRLHTLPSHQTIGEHRVFVCVCVFVRAGVRVRACVRACVCCVFS